MSTRTISHDTFLKATERQGLPAEVAETIWADLDEPVAAAYDAAPLGVGLRRKSTRFSETPRLTSVVSVLLYLGGLLVIGSYGWWATQPDLGDGGLLALSLFYGAAFLGVAFVARSRGLDELAAMAATIVAFYVPVCAYAALSMAGFRFEYAEDGVAGFYEWIDGGWIWMELAAIAAALVLYRVFRAPLLMLPLSLFTFFLAMDGAARAFGLDWEDGSQRAVGAFVLAFGFLAVGAGVALDYRGWRRHAFWLHVFGALGVVWGIGFLLGDDSVELALIISGVAFLLLGVWLARVTYLVAGGLALWSGITFLEPSPFIVTISGLTLVGVAVWLSVGTSPFRRWLQTRPLPAPQRD